MTLHLGKGLTLPDELAGDTMAILARKGAGKTYTAGVLVEELVEAKIPAAVLDPMGAFWGLRASADGEHDGLGVIVLGGEHGDIPLESTGGRVVADLVVEEPSWYILDLTGFKTQAEQDRFAYDFADRLYRAKATADKRATLHLVVDEADQFAPQNLGASGDKGGIRPKMLGAFEAIARRGRIRGIGSTWITQRPASLNKNVLTQAEVLIFLQLTSPQDRKAVRDWAEGYATKAEIDAFLASLAPLKRGNGWVWSPSLLELFQPVAIRERRTFDSSRTPKPGEFYMEPRCLADVDVAALNERMAATIERAKATDPAILRDRVTALERELRAARHVAELAAAAPSVTETIVETIEVPVVPQHAVEALRGALGLYDETLDSLRGLREAVAFGLHELENAAPTPRLAPNSGAHGAPTPRIAAPTPVQRRATPAPSPASAADDGYRPRAGARRMLEALATFPDGLTRSQLGTMAKVKKSGGTFSTYASELRRAGLISIDGQHHRITTAGLDEVGGAPLPSDPEALREEWATRLGSKNGARRMYDLLVETYPRLWSKDAISEAAEIELTGGSFSTYLSRLRSNGLVEEVDGQMRAHPDLFLVAS